MTYDSILGQDLEIERQRAFHRRFGYLSLNKHKLRLRADRTAIGQIEEAIRSEGGGFVATEDQFRDLCSIERRLKSPTDLSGLQEDLLREGREILRQGALPSGRLLYLDELIGISEKRALKPGELATLQFYVMEGAGAWMSGADTAA